ncbi:MAG: ABC transporter substrate-binding protein [Marinobacter sp.]
MLASPAQAVAAPGPSDASGPRIATVDWTLAETLLALDVVPVAVAQVRDYQAWVSEPRLPDNVVDLGLRAQPNRELVASLELDRFLLSPMYQAIEPAMARMVPVTSLATYTAEGDLWDNLLETTRQLGALTGREDRADRVIRQHRQHVRRVRQTLPDDLPPLMVVQFIDDRHVRVFGEGSLYEMVMQRLGLENAWEGGTNLWGFSTAGIEELSTRGYLVIVDPMPMGVEKGLATNQLWQSLPAVRHDRVLQLPPVWSFGALPSASRFAEQLGQALKQAVTTDDGTS